MGGYMARWPHHRRNISDSHEVQPDKSCRGVGKWRPYLRMSFTKIALICMAVFSLAMIANMLWRCYRNIELVLPSERKEKMKVDAQIQIINMTTPKTDTPRTDAEVGVEVGATYCFQGEFTKANFGITVPAEFARTLERELAEAQREIARLKAHLSGVASKPASLQWHYAITKKGELVAQITTKAP